MRKVIAFLLVFLALGLIFASAFAEDINLTIVSPKEGSETFGGRDIEITVRAGVSDSTSLSFLGVSSEREACQVVKKDEIYRCAATVPTDLELATFTITATAKWKTVTRTDTATLTLNVTNQLRIELVYPEPVAATGIEEDKKHVEVRLMFPEGDKQYDLATVVPADINGEKVNFVWDAEEKVFVAEYDLERLEKGKRLQMKISLLGDVSGEKTFYPTIAAEGVFGEREKFPVEVVASMIGTGAVAVVIAVWFFAFRKKRAENMEELEVKRERLVKLMKLEEIDFYKRRITEDEFKKRRFERQEELNEVNAKLEALGGKVKAGALEQKTAQ